MKKYSFKLELLCSSKTVAFYNSMSERTMKITSFFLPVLERMKFVGFIFWSEQIFMMIFDDAESFYDIFL